MEIILLDGALWRRVSQKAGVLVEREAPGGWAGAGPSGTFFFVVLGGNSPHEFGKPEDEGKLTKRQREDCEAKPTRR